MIMLAENGWGLNAVLGYLRLNLVAFVSVCLAEVRKHGKASYVWVWSMELIKCIWNEEYLIGREQLEKPGEKNWVLVETI